MHWLRIIKSHRNKILCVCKRLPIKIGKTELAKLGNCREVFLKRQKDQISQNFSAAPAFYFLTY